MASKLAKNRIEIQEKLVAKNLLATKRKKVTRIIGSRALRDVLNREIASHLTEKMGMRHAVNLKIARIANLLKEKNAVMHLASHLTEKMGMRRVVNLKTARIANLLTEKNAVMHLASHLTEKMGILHAVNLKIVM